jgi:hypothetical protein
VCYVVCIGLESEEYIDAITVPSITRIIFISPFLSVCLSVCLSIYPSMHLPPSIPVS